MIQTFKYRVKSNLGALRRQAQAVNFVWNFCNNTQKTALRWKKKWPTGFDLDHLTTGSSKDLNLHSGTINSINAQYTKSRSQKNRPYLRYRGRKSLGWIPFKGRDIKQTTDGFKFSGKLFRLFFSRKLPENHKILDGSSFSQDSEGHWYLNLVINIEENRQIITTKEELDCAKSVGIDLGLKDFAILSTGEMIESPKFYRKLEQKLGVNQRANKKKQVRILHAKIKNSRKDFHHKLSTRLVKEFEAIAVGNINASGLAKTNMAKSVLDAGWSSFRNMLRYKAIRHGTYFQEVNESFTTRICSSCGNKTGPKGVADLGIRNWMCSVCGVSHNRDTNAAMNIRSRLGYQAPDEGTHS